MNELKYCPRCERHLPLSEFGICRARPDGLNLYDKRCIRQKIALSRQRLREYKLARGLTGRKRVSRPSARSVARVLRKLSPAERVREIIRSKASSLSDIILAARLPTDEVTDIIAHLLLDNRDIRTAMVGDTRMYFTSDGQIRRTPIRPREPRSYGVSSVYFAV